jgi:hydroxypyruvate isomerase
MPKGPGTGALEARPKRTRGNVAWAAERARAQGASSMIEAVSSYENGPYLLATTARPVSFLDAVGADNIARRGVHHMPRLGPQSYMYRYISIHIASSPATRWD